MDRDTPTFGHVCQFGEKLVELLLTVCQFAAAAEIDTEAIHDTVDDEEAEFIAGKVSGKRIEEFKLMLWTDVRTVVLQVGVSAHGI